MRSMASANIRHGGRMLLLLAIAIATIGLHPGRALAQTPTITATPALQPAFDPSVPNYVTSCEPSESVEVSGNGNGEAVSVDAQPAQTGAFDQTLSLSAGQLFTIVVGSGADAQTYNVRCLPENFPTYTVQRPGTPQAGYYLVAPDLALSAAAPESYVILFDNHGVPVWWYDQSDGTPINASLMSNGDLAWDVQTAQNPFGEPGIVHLEEHSLDGTLVNTLTTSGSPTDFHEATELSNGDFLMTSYVPQTVSLLSIGVPWPTEVLQASFQEVEPDGTVAYSWNSYGKLTPAESLGWTDALYAYPGAPGLVWDWQHINSVAPYEQGFLVSMRNTNAIFYIRASTGDVVWKLGGTTTPQSLRIVGDPDAATDFGGQHDARVWPDGTISVQDDGTSRNRPPRVLRFRIYPTLRIAQLVQTITDPAVTSSPCCGSARLLPGGDWVVAWGGSQDVDEINAANQLVFQLAFAAPYFTYRAFPILSDQLSLPAIEAGMSAMYPRTPGGS